MEGDLNVSLKLMLMVFVVVLELSYFMPLSLLFADLSVT